MNYSEFESRYGSAAAGLKSIVGSLRKALVDAIKALPVERKRIGLDVRKVQIRLHEVRTKDCDSIYTKVKGDRKLDFERALGEPGHLRDLIGARLVCHTLDDVKYLDESIKKDTLVGLHYVEPPKGVKDWTEQPNSEGGYRSLHLDVKWPNHDGTNNYAELQLRTILQDAWASIFHDKLYKGAEGVLPPQMHERARAISDELHRIDKEMGELIRQIESFPLSGQGRIKYVEAIHAQMYAIAGIGGADLTAPRYRTVRRKDLYVVGPEPLFDFTIDAECHRPRQFVHVLGGDTPSSAMNVELVEVIDNAGTPTALRRGAEYDVRLPKHPNRMALVRRQGLKEKRHHYRIVCRWPDVFNSPLEYVWSPWRTMYPNASINYQLRLEFVKPPESDPRLIELTNIDGLDAAIKAYQDGGGEPMRYLGETKRRHVFTFEDEKLRDVLCLFRP